MFAYPNDQECFPLLTHPNPLLPEDAWGTEALIPNQLIQRMTSYIVDTFFNMEMF